MFCSLSSHNFLQNKPLSSGIISNCRYTTTKNGDQTLLKPNTYFKSCSCQIIWSMQCNYYQRPAVLSSLNNRIENELLNPDIELPNILICAFLITKYILYLTKSNFYPGNILGLLAIGLFYKYPLSTRNSYGLHSNCI